MHKPTVLALIIGAGLAAPQLSRAELLLYYNFDNFGAGPVTNGATIDNLVAGRPDGTFRGGTAGGSATFTSGNIVTGGNLGRSLQLTPFADSNDNLLAPNIDTAFTAIQLSITPTTPYTVMAWANFASTANDNMIFGQVQTVPGTTQVLHHGSRGGNYHSGHWADDIVTTAPGTGNGLWHHVAFTNDAAGTQTIVVDGVQIAGGPGNGTTPISGAMVTSLNVVIGTSGNQGSFNGQLDEIKVYNELLTPAQIQAASAVPEPASVGLLALGAAALGLLGRRKRAQ